MTGEGYSGSAAEGAGGEPAPSVGVALVNWNAREALAGCLESLFGFHPGLKLEVLVVDNASRDGSIAMLKERFPRVGLIGNRVNRGFAAACNQAFAGLDPRSPYLLALNPDVRFTRDTLGPLLSFLENNPRAHVVTPRILDPDGSLQATCRRRDPRPAALFWRVLGLGRLFPKSRIFAGYTYGDLPENLTHQIEAASGSFLLLRREVLREAGGFDERFFLYAEDLDWCLRVREHGFSIYYCAEAEVLHYGGVSSSKRPIARVWHLYHTAFQYLAKNRAREYSGLKKGLVYLLLVIFFVLSLPVAAVRQMICFLKGLNRLREPR